MKYSEFEENCRDFWNVNDLIDFAYDADLYSVTEDICTEDSKDEMIDESIRHTNLSWQELRDELASVPTCEDYYWCNDGGSYFGFTAIDDDDFGTIKDLILDAMAGEWDPEDDDEGSDPFEDEHIDYSKSMKSNQEDDEQEFELPEFDAGHLFDTCSGAVQTMCAMQECIKQKEMEEFEHSLNNMDPDFKF